MTKSKYDTLAGNKLVGVRDKVHAAIESQGLNIGSDIEMQESDTGSVREDERFGISLILVSAPDPRAWQGLTKI